MKPEQDISDMTVMHMTELIRDRAWMAEFTCGQGGRMDQGCLGN